MKNAKSIICAATLVLAVSISTPAKTGLISATKTGMISATKTGLISATRSEVSTQATGTAQSRGSLNSFQFGIFELLLTAFQPW